MNDNTTTLKIHISEELFQSIKKLSSEGNQLVCPYVKKVAELLLPILTKNLGYKFCDFPIYEVFKSEHDVKFSISKQNYKKLKIAHCEINTYSMGVIMRWLIKFTVNLAQKVGLKKMWRLIKVYLKKFIRKTMKLNVSVDFIKLRKYDKKTKKTKTIPKIEVVIYFQDLYGKMCTNVLNL